MTHSGVTPPTLSDPLLSITGLTLRINDLELRTTDVYPTHDAVFARFDGADVPLFVELTLAHGVRVWRRLVADKLERPPALYSGREQLHIARSVWRDVVRQVVEAGSVQSSGVQILATMDPLTDQAVLAVRCAWGEGALEEEACGNPPPASIPEPCLLQRM